MIAYIESFLYYILLALALLPIFSICIFIIKDTNIYLLEINTLLGLSEKSSLTLMLKTIGVTVDEYIKSMISK